MNTARKNTGTTITTNTARKHGHDHHDKHGKEKHGHGHHDEHGKEKHGHGKEKHGHGHGHGHGHKHGKHKHNHDAAVFSVGVVREGDIDHDVMCYRLQNILKTKGEDVYRMKGILSIEGQSTNFVL